MKKSTAEVTVIGDSHSPGLKPFLNARLRTSVKVRSLPGRCNSDIQNKAKRSQMSETDVVALMVSGNDLYRKYDKAGLQ